MGWVVRFVLFLVVVRLIWLFVRGLLQGLAPEEARERKARAVPLVRDPVCGKFVVRARALTSGTGESTQYFCSEQCRDHYARHT